MTYYESFSWVDTNLYIHCGGYEHSHTDPRLLEISMSLAIPPDVAQHLKLLSHSSDELLNDCTQKFKIQKLRHRFGAMEYAEGDFHLDFGSIVGIGIQEYMKEKSFDAAYWAMFTSWKQSIDTDEGQDKKKTFWHSLVAIDKFKLFLETEMRHVDLVSFDGTPAVELGFTIDCGDGFFYRGFLDMLLWNSLGEELVPWEGKTEGGYNEPNEASYRNKGQHKGYKLIIDAVSRRLGLPIMSSYDAYYGVYKPMKEEWHRFNFKTSNVTLARWIKGLLIQKERIMMMAESNFFPINGSACYKYYKPCKYFGVCESDDAMLFGKNWEKVEPRKEDGSKVYQFHFKLDELIETLLEK